jgi:hypothetical protein
MIKRYASHQVLSLAIIASLVPPMPLLAQSLTGEDKAFLLGILPAGAEDVSTRARMSLALPTV